MLRKTLAETKSAPALLLSMLLSTAGFGLVLPYLFIYLTDVRHLDPTWVGLAGAWIGVAGLAAAGPSGALVDRFGPRRVFFVLSVLQGGGLVGYAFVHSVWQAFFVATFAAMGGPPAIGAIDTLFAAATTEESRQHFFGLSFVAVNVGVGLGGLVGGAIADVSHPSSFELLYGVAGVAVAVGAVVILFTRGIGNSEAADPHAPSHGGYRALLKDRVFLRLLVVGMLLMACAYGQLEYGFTAFAADVAHVSTRAVGWAFAANCFTIVVIQLAVLPRLEGRSRSRLLAVASTLIGISWLVLATGAVGHGGGSAAIASVVACGVVFALGEVLMSPVMPALTNSLATDALRGRYNTVTSMTFGVTSIAGPLTGAPLIGHGLWGIWLLIVVACGVAAASGALTLRAHLTPEQDGRSSVLA